MIQKDNSMARYIFQHQEKSKLTAKQFRKVLKPQFSPEGSNRRSSQEIELTKLIDFMICTGL